MSNGEVQPRSEHFAVYKYQFPVTDVVRLQLPHEARILAVAQQAGVRSGLQLWAHIDKRKPLVERVFVVYGTGHDMPAEPGIFIGTVLVNGGALVWHVYDAGEVH